MKTTHTHHIIPRHAGGTDEPENLIELTVEEHAEAHRLLWEQFGRWEDEIAWKTLSGQISGYEAQQEARRLANINNKHFAGKTHSEEYKLKLSEMMTLRRKNNSNLGNFSSHSEETKLKISERLKGNSNKAGKTGAKLSDDFKEFRKLAMKGDNNPAKRIDVKEKLKISASKKLKCEYCGREMNAGNMSRHLKSAH